MAYTAECDGCGRSGTVVTDRGEYVASGRQLIRHIGSEHYCYSRRTLGTCTYTRWKDAESAASDVGPDVPTANDADLEHVVTEHGGIPGLLEVEHPECRDDRDDLGTVYECQGCGVKTIQSEECMQCGSDDLTPIDE